MSRVISSIGRGLLACVIVAFVACGGGSGEQQAADTAQQAPATGQAANPMAEMARAMGGSGDMKPVDPVDFQELQALLPEISSWERGDASGSKMTMPVSFSQAEVTYTKGDASIKATLIDTGFNGLLLAPYQMFLTMGFSQETEEGYEKSTQVAGYAGWEKWNRNDKSGEVHALVGKRFLLNLEGEHIADTKVLLQLAGQIDLKKLEGMK